MSIEDDQQREEPEVLDTQVVSEEESGEVRIQYLRGWHPRQGILHIGWTGQETKRGPYLAIRPIGRFTVVDSRGEDVNNDQASDPEILSR